MNTDKVYILWTYTENTDPDDEGLMDFLGVAMSEKRAKEIADGYNPGEGWVKTDEHCWLMPAESKWDHSATIEICYEPLDVL